MQPRRLVPPRLVLPLVIAAIAISYVFIITAGTFTKWPTWNTTYDEMAEGFRSGHLYIPMQPSAELLAQPNPYDWSNVRLWYWDASLYKGHYYWYFAPLPGLLVAGVKTLFRIDATVGDQFPLFLFYLVYLVAGALFIDRMARRLFPAISRGLVLLAVCLFAYANPTPYMLATPGGYQAAIAGGQAFMLLGLLFAFDAVWSARAGEPPRRRVLIAAGTAWGLAIACRVSIGMPVLLLGCATLLAMARKSPERRRRLIRDGSYLLAPVAICVLALLAYNKARFDEWFEFGLKYDLNTMPLTPSAAFLPLNLYSYLMRPMALSCEFPFVFALPHIGARGFPFGIRLPEGYSTPEPLVGLFPSAPWTLLALLGVGLVIRAIVKRYRSGEATDPSDFGRRIGLWCVACFAVMGTVTLLPVAAVPFSTMRFLADISTGIVLLAIWGAWTGYGRLEGRPRLRRVALAAGVVLAGLTLVFGGLLGVQGYDGMFKMNNPPLYDVMVRRLSMCGS